MKEFGYNAQTLLPDTFIVEFEKAGACFAACRRAIF
jgi:hypothetical protein